MEENMKRILVVDDEQDLCEILKFNLETEGYEVETANLQKRLWRWTSLRSTCCCWTS